MGTSLRVRMVAVFHLCDSDMLSPEIDELLDVYLF